MSYNPDETLAQELARERAIAANKKPEPVIFNNKRAFRKAQLAPKKAFASKVDVLARKFQGEFVNSRGC